MITATIILRDTPAIHALPRHSFGRYCLAAVLRSMDPSTLQQIRVLEGAVAAEETRVWARPAVLPS